MLHHAELCSLSEVEAALKQSKSQFELYRYDEQHAFMNEVRPEVYDAVSAKAASERTLEFRKRHSRKEPQRV